MCKFTVAPQANRWKHCGEQTASQLLKGGGDYDSGIGCEMEGKPRFRRGFSELEETLVLLSLALDAVLCPGYRIQTLFLDFSLT